MWCVCVVYCCVWCVYVCVCVCIVCLCVWCGVVCVASEVSEVR